MDVIDRLAKLIVLCLFVVSLPAQAAKANAPGPQLISYYDLVRLSPEKQMAYIKALQEILTHVEEQQTKMGVKYQTANLDRSLLRLLLDEAEAQTVFAAGKPCIFAGDVSVYAAANKMTCSANPKCPGKPGQIVCNPLLYGDDLCTEAKDGATARCSRNSKLSAEEMAKQLREKNKIPQWMAFKERFKSFCDGVFATPGDFNARSCKYIKNRLDEIEKNLNIKPSDPAKQTEVMGPPAPETPPATAREPAVAEAPAPLKPTRTVPACGDAKANNGGTCMACAPAIADSTERPIQVSDYERTKYGQLLTIMAKNCATQTTDQNVPQQPKSQELILSSLGGCDALDYAGWEIRLRNAKEAALIEGLEKGDPSAQEKINSDFWNQDARDAFATYFGFTPNEARGIFCSDAPVNSRLQKIPEFPELATGYTATLEEQRAYYSKDVPLKDTPNWVGTGGRLFESDKARLLRRNNARAQYNNRKNLLSCLKKNQSLPKRFVKTTGFQKYPNCIAEFYDIDPSQLSLAISTLTPKNSASCISRTVNGVTANWVCKQCGTTATDKSPVCICDALNKETGIDLSGPVTVSTLNCATGSFTPVSSKPGSGGATQ